MRHWSLQALRLIVAIRVSISSKEMGFTDRTERAEMWTAPVAGASANAGQPFG
jgi:hypothetical protein